MKYKMRVPMSQLIKRIENGEHFTVKRKPRPWQPVREALEAIPWGSGGHGYTVYMPTDPNKPNCYEGKP